MIRKSVSVRTWQLQEAKARLSELFTHARTRGPQKITRHGKDAVVVVAAEEFERLSGNVQPTNLAELLMHSPLKGSGIRIERARDYGRKIEL